MVRSTKALAQTGGATELSQIPASELLRLHAQISDELRARKITRSANNPVGDLAEHLFCKAFGCTQASNSHANVDAVDKDQVRYQNKARRLTRDNQSRQMSAIRDLPAAHFDFLAGVLFGEDCCVLRAAIIPYAVVMQHASFVKQTNSLKFLLRDDVWDAPGVRDVTDEWTAVQLIVGSFTAVFAPAPLCRRAFMVRTSIGGNASRLMDS